MAWLLLRYAGNSAISAADAGTGLSAARSEYPDLILMDIQLPDMDRLGGHRAFCHSEYFADCFDREGDEGRLGKELNGRLYYQAFALSGAVRGQ